MHEDDTNPTARFANVLATTQTQTGIHKKTTISNMSHDNLSRHEHVS